MPFEARYFSRMMFRSYSVRNSSIAEVIRLTDSVTTNIIIQLFTPKALDGCTSLLITRHATATIRVF